jgi:hypothetical protein
VRVSTQVLLSVVHKTASVYRSFASIHTIQTRLYLCDHREPYVFCSAILANSRLVSELVVAAEEVRFCATVTIIH